MARLSLILLVLIAAAGIIFSLLPSPPPRVIGNVALEDVSVVLFPDADRDARWAFKSNVVTYDPDTRESVVQGASQGYRYVGKKLDLVLRARDIVIDANENLRLQKAIVYIPSQCMTLNLGRDGQPPVYIDQGQGYRASQAILSGPNIRSEMTGFSASFDLRQTDVTHSVDSVDPEGGQKCVNGRILKSAK